MARLKSEEKRVALLNAATELVALRGLSAPTSKIARHAGLAEGTLFLYFPTKDDLLNELFVHLKRDLHDHLLRGHDPLTNIADRNRRFWDNYIRWGVENNEKSRALVQLSVSNRIRPEVRESVGALFFDLGETDTTYRNAFPTDMLAFADAVATAIAQVTVDFATKHEGEGEPYTEAGFNVMWKVIS